MQAINKPQSQTVSVELAAAELGIGRTTLYQAVKRGEVPVLRIGRRIVVRRATIARLLADPAALPHLAESDTPAAD